MIHHEVFYKFKCWEGEIEAGFRPNFLGVMTRESFLLEPQPSERRFVATQYPAVNEMYFEWIDVLEAVTAARGQFTMIELGAGWGRWLVNAAAALRYYSGLPCRLIGVEAEPTHFRWMRMHFRDNGLDPDRHQLIQAAVAGKDGKVWFLTGCPSKCYGQAIVRKPSWSQRLRELFATGRSEEDFHVKRVKAVSLNTLLQPLDQIDLVDLDVQGAEFVVLKAAAEQLEQKVKKVHIETHNHEIESGLRSLFRDLGWKNVYDYAISSEVHTQCGTVEFGGGLQTWINPRLLVVKPAQSALPG